MKEPDRKVLWALVVVLTTIALEFALIAFVFPHDQGSYQAANDATYQNGHPNDVWWHYADAWIAIFTVVLTVSTVLLWWTTLRSTRLAERTFSELERPYIYISGVTNLNGSRADNIADYPGVSYIVANFGKTPAVIQEVRIGLITAKTEPKIPIPADRDHYLLTSFIIAPGEQRRIREYLPEYIDAAAPSDAPFVLVPLLKKSDRLFLYVVVYYSGPFNKGCKTSACWRWSDGEGVFVRYGGEKYNYVI